MKTNIIFYNFLQLLLTLLTIFFSSCISEQPDEQPIKNGLVSCYTFQGNADDTYGINNGIENNVEYRINYYPINNQVALFKGDYSYIMLPDSFDYESRTINLWFNTFGPSGELEVIYSSDNPNLKYGLTVLSIQLIDNHINLYFNVSNQPDTIEIGANTWYNATIATYGKQYMYYLNGNPIFTGSFEDYACSTSGNSTAVLGTDRTLNRRFFYGYVDDLRIFNRKLSDAEISTLANLKTAE